ncbi:MAG: replication initiator protein A, partial [Lachnospiraceae bacterium]|nr:replication initiator protein A [Lachnospiraceae bacterium]
MEQYNYDYYYGIEGEQFAFFRIPKILITDKRYKDLSLAAKMLYGLMLERIRDSQKYIRFVYISNENMKKTVKQYAYYKLGKVKA